MNAAFTRILGRKILLVFLILTIIFSTASIFIRNTITKKLQVVSKFVYNPNEAQTKAEHALLLLHQAEDDFQESLVNSDSKKNSDYKMKLSGAFGEIDSLLNQKIISSQLTEEQGGQIKLWYKRKVELSDKLYDLKHNFDSLLSVSADYHSKIIEATGGIDTVKHHLADSTKSRVSATKIPIKKKGLLRRIKDAISNKTDSAAFEINHYNNTHSTDHSTQTIIAHDRGAFVSKLKRLQQLQHQNISLLKMQRDLIKLNTDIINKMEVIINDIKDINYNLTNSLKGLVLKNYKETNDLLNKFYLVALILVMAFSVSLIVFIIQIYKSEMRLRKENELSIHTAQEKINELTSKIILNDSHSSESKMEELKHIVELAVNNNPAFLLKFNEFDPEFNKKLLQKAPGLTAVEIEFCALLRLNFETKEIARYTKTSVRSVEGKKYRIRKKLDIPTDKDINFWMTTM
jgi:DNA-binding CsgD family transcriptional regulator